MQTLLISACLLGKNCTYRGDSNALDDKTIRALKEKYKLIPVCPEVAGGLSTPRNPAENKDDRVVTISGEDVTDHFNAGAQVALKLAEMNSCKLAVMKQSSPSCGSKTIYDGTFSHKIIPGMGVAAKLLNEKGVKVMSEENINEIISENEITLEDILKKCDHTLLRVDCTANEIKTLCDQAIKYNCASVCIPPCHVAGAKRYVGDRLKICTVIGFPNGYSTSSVKAFEAGDAVTNGADEIDMVINLSMVKDEAWDDLREDIMAVRRVTMGKILKVIIECCLLTDEEKIKLCDIVSECKADFIKTSTGFSKGGATFEDVELMRNRCSESVKVKAAGGISTIDDAVKFIQLGAERLGTSRIVKIAEQQ